MEAGELESAFDGFRAAIREENAIKAGPLRKFACQRTLKRVVKKIRKMDCARGLATDDFDDARMRVAQCVDGDAAEKIEIFFAARVIDIAAAPMGEDDGLTLVGRHQKLIRIAQDGLCFWRGEAGLARLTDRGDGRLPSLCVDLLGHHAAERAAWALERGSRRTRVPGIAEECSSALSSAE